MRYLFVAILFTSSAALADVAPKETVVDAPLGVRVSVKMVAPYDQTTPLQIVCVFKHKPGGDTYVESMKVFDDKLGGIVSALRDRGEMVGELGETLLFDAPASSIKPSRVLLIGLGEESRISLDALRVVGRVALRESVRLGVTTVTFAPTIRDQGNTTIDVGDGDRAVIEEVLLAYATEKQLQAQGLAPSYTLASWTIEAGPKFFDAASEKVALGARDAAAKLAARTRAPYARPTAK
jgi:hypothetical protein